MPKSEEKDKVQMIPHPGDGARVVVLDENGKPAKGLRRRKPDGYLYRYFREPSFGRKNEKPEPPKLQEVVLEYVDHHPPFETLRLEVEVDGKIEHQLFLTLSKAYRDRGWTLKTAPPEAKKAS